MLDGIDTIALVAADFIWFGVKNILFGYEFWHGLWVACIACICFGLPCSARSEKKVNVI